MLNKIKFNLKAALEVGSLVSIFGAAAFIGIVSSSPAQAHCKPWHPHHCRHKPPIIRPFVEQKTCSNVDSRKGWQTVVANHAVSSTNYIEGGWSVDARSYSMVSYGGHEGLDAERLTPFNASKYDQRFPFGALLMDVPNHGVVWVDNPTGYLVRKVGFPAGSTFRLRINDADNALGDNGGSLRVCLVEGIG